jgi:hypothetical protein
MYYFNFDYKKEITVIRLKGHADRIAWFLRLLDDESIEYDVLSKTRIAISDYVDFLYFAKLIPPKILLISIGVTIMESYIKGIEVIQRFWTDHENFDEAGLTLNFIKKMAKKLKITFTNPCETVLKIWLAKSPSITH